MQAKLIHAINLETRENQETPVLLADLRKRLPGLRKVLFDKEILRLSKSGRYFLSKHFDPSRLTKAELSLMVPNGQGGYFYAITPIDDAAAGPAPTPLAQGQARSCKPPLPQKHVPDGGSLAARKKGRPPVPDHLRRIQIRPGYRVSAWVADWVKEQGDVGKIIEAALIGHYKLTPPEP